MMLNISQNKSIGELQKDFNSHYPFLKVEFYPNNVGLTSSSKRKHLLNSMPIERAGLIKNGYIDLDDLMTVGQLENIFRTEFGLSAQVSRKSGALWLETTMTDGWTLKQQNDHGRELSEPLVRDTRANDRY